MEIPIEVGEDRYQADKRYVYATDPVLRFDQRRLASMVGYVAIGLPIALALGGIFLGKAELGAFRQSLSGFYYENVLLGDVFVGALFFIGTLMLAYRGWSRKVADLATAAGMAAWMVALFPAAGWIVGDEGSAVFVTATAILHAVSAGVLFLILAFFCFFVFTKVENHQVDGMGSQRFPKKMRDKIYRVTGVLILLAMAVIGLGSYLMPELSQKYRVTYWAEAVALIAFGISWLVQGRASGTLLMDRRDLRDRLEAEAREKATE